MPNGNPCAIAIFNNKRMDLDVIITGYGVKAYSTKITLPFNRTELQLTNNTLRIEPNDNVVLLYIGSTTSKE